MVSLRDSFVLTHPPSLKIQRDKKASKKIILYSHRTHRCTKKRI